MEMTKADSLKEELMSSNPEFRELAREHGRYEQRLSELSGLSYPSDEEQLEEVTLKKKKLAIKDQMYSLMLQYEKAVNVGHRLFFIFHFSFVIGSTASGAASGSSSRQNESSPGRKTRNGK